MLLKVQDPLSNIKLIKELINEIEVFMTNDEINKIEKLNIPLENLIIMRK